MSTTEHKIIFRNSQSLSGIKSQSVHLVVTSPPYPMIEMWDKIFGSLNSEITIALKEVRGYAAFELMHRELDKTWNEINRVVVPGGIVCINIGDATRTINGEFALYSNHARIISAFLKMGFTNLPNIIWRKQTNAPNKFMGSGMLPAGAYVTLEHEWILVFRRGNKREFKTTPEKLKRQNSAFFWEERNVWFSDVWDIKGVKQQINGTSRERTGAYPLLIPYRLINMFSLKDDIVLDPFLGTGTTTMAAMISERNSVGFEIDESFKNNINGNITDELIKKSTEIINNRLLAHKNFITELGNAGRVTKHFNNNIHMEVVTSQEKVLEFHYVESIHQTGDMNYSCRYSAIDIDIMEPVTESLDKL